MIVVMTVPESEESDDGWWWWWEKYRCCGLESPRRRHMGSKHMGRHIPIDYSQQG
jgi:hypothetical protein